MYNVLKVNVLELNLDLLGAGDIYTFKEMLDENGSPDVETVRRSLYNQIFVLSVLISQISKLLLTLAFLNH